MGYFGWRCGTSLGCHSVTGFRTVGDNQSGKDRTRQDSCEVIFVNRQEEYNFPMVYAAPKGLLQLLKAYPPEIRKLALETRQIVLEELAPCHEYILQVYTIAMGYSPNGKMRDQICHVTTHSQHVNLGFGSGAFMPDPEGILLGEGSRIRHIKIASHDDLARPAIRNYLRTALQMADVEDMEDRIADGVVSVVKLCGTKKLRVTAPKKTAGKPRSKPR